MPELHIMVPQLHVFGVAAEAGSCGGHPCQSMNQVITAWSPGDGAGQRSTGHLGMVVQGTRRTWNQSLINLPLGRVPRCMHGSWTRYRHPKLDDLCERWGLPYTDCRPNHPTKPLVQLSGHHR